MRKGRLGRGARRVAKYEYVRAPTTAAAITTAAARAIRPGATGKVYLALCECISRRSPPGRTWPVIAITAIALGGRVTKGTSEQRRGRSSVVSRTLPFSRGHALEPAEL